MSDRVQTALDRFLGGELALSELQSELGAILAAQPDAAPLIGSQLDELYRGGQVPLQVYRILSALIGRDEIRAPKAFSARVDDEDATRNDATRRQPVGGSERAWGDSSAPGLSLDERTVIPVADVEFTRVPAAPAAFDTGSNWSHPEQWSSRGETVLGVGSVIKDRFVLESVLGQGGMGVVYRALDRRKEEAQDSDLYVAIKILNDEFRRHPKALVALQREARKAQTLAHPNVITVHDFDRDGTTVYMTMELLDGEPLSSTIKANKLAGLPPDRAVPIIRAMGTALAYAHRKDIVHSDLKPGNVFVTAQGDVKVLDFGIARAVRTELRPESDRTAFDAAELGALTPAYASPEMLRGQPPMPADDVFALGVVAHELLTGRHPFDRLPADRAQERGLEPAALRMLPRRQRVAIAKALSFERARRHVNATTFLAHFDGPSPIRKAAYAATVIALVGVAGYAFYLNTQVRPDIPFSDLPLEAQQAFKTAIADGAQGLKFGALNDAFELYSRAYEIHRNDPQAIDGLESVADRFLAGLPEAESADRRALMQKLYCHEYLATYRPVVKACQSMLGGQCSVAGLSCPRSDARP
jgi:serine/threonine protein kinase